MSEVETVDELAEEMREAALGMQKHVTTYRNLDGPVGAWSRTLCEANMLRILAAFEKRTKALEMIEQRRISFAEKWKENGIDQKELMLLYGLALYSAKEALEE